MKNLIIIAGIGIAGWLVFNSQSNRSVITVKTIEGSSWGGGQAVIEYAGKIITLPAGRTNHIIAGKPISFDGVKVWYNGKSYGTGIIKI